MEKIFFNLKNNSGSEGSYLYKDEYKILKPGMEVTLESRPTSVTENITVSYFLKEVTPQTQIIRKKSNKDEGEQVNG